jgi:hypothetical protein
MGGFLYRLPVEYYVSTTGNDSNPGTRASPFLTIGRARTAVQAIGGAMDRDVVVYLRGGRYLLSTAEAFTPSDSGQNGYTVTYRAMPHERVYISGGSQISSWSDQGSGLWRASTSLNFRQLYVNDVRATRARFPKAPTWGEVVFWNEADEEIELEAGHADEAADAQEVVIVGHGVNNCILRLASVTGAVITGQATENGRLFVQEYPPKGDGNLYFLQGGLDLCTAEGEWHLDTVNDFIYYRPLGGEDMATATVFAPTVEKLFTLIGTDLDTPVHDLTFYDLTFEHSTWMLPSTEGYVGDQSSTYFVEALPVDQVTSYPSPPVPAAVHLDTVDDVRFERCVWQHCGGGGINLHRAVTDATIIGNVFYDLSGSGVSVDTNFEGNTGDSRKPCRRVTVSNNYIEQIGQEYFCSVGVHFGYVDSGVIEQNEVTDCPYLGISVGWGWSYETMTTNGNIVRRNEVWDVCWLEADSGGIYTLGKQRNGGSPSDGLIEHNYVHTIARGIHSSTTMPLAGIYLDQGTGDIDVQNNVVDITTGTNEHLVFQNGNGSNVSLSDNDATDPGGVVANAGLLPAYEDIRELVA